MVATDITTSDHVSETKAARGFAVLSLPVNRITSANLQRQGGTDLKTDILTQQFYGISAMGRIMKSGKIDSSLQLQRSAEFGTPRSCYYTGFRGPYDGQCEALPSEDAELMKKKAEGQESSPDEFSLNRLWYLRDVRGLIISLRSMEADLAHT